MLTEKMKSQSSSPLTSVLNRISGTGRGAFGAGCLASAVDPPAAAVRDADELLDVDMDQLTRLFTLIATDRFLGCTIARVEPAETLSNEDPLHCLCGASDFERDVIGAPTALFRQLDELPPRRLRRPVR